MYPEIVCEKTNSKYDLQDRLISACIYKCTTHQCCLQYVRTSGGLPGFERGVGVVDASLTSVDSEKCTDESSSGYRYRVHRRFCWLTRDSVL